jgi:CBS domain-containing protein
MSISELCNREVIIIQRDETVLKAAKLMRQHHVGNVIVVDEHDGSRIPVGIVTDRDVVVEVLAPELDPSVITVGDIMTPELFTAKKSMELFDAIQFMRSKSIRRLPVVNEADELIGILTLDDVLELLSEEMVNLVKLVRYEQKKEILHRP